MAQGEEPLTQQNPKGKIKPSAPPENQHSPSDNTVKFVASNGETVSLDRATVDDSKELTRIVTETSPINGKFRLHDITSSDLKIISDFFTTDVIKFQDLEDALQKLEIARRFHWLKLVRRCVKEVDSNITLANVIKVFVAIRFHVAAKNENLQKQLHVDKRTAEDCLQALLHNVFQFIDQNANVVLQRDEILDAHLSFAEIE